MVRMIVKTTAIVAPRQSRLDRHTGRATRRRAVATMYGPAAPMQNRATGNRYLRSGPERPDSPLTCRRRAELKADIDQKRGAEITSAWVRVRPV